MTRYPDLFRALAAPFDASQVKERPGGNGRKLSYITARTAMNRLDEVLGPENWQDEFYEVCDVLFCRIKITLPDGTTVSKCDAGGFKEMTERDKGQVVTDEENTDKTGPSDAFKRAAAKFGIARYLYNDGVARLEAQPAPAASAAPAKLLHQERHPSDAWPVGSWDNFLDRVINEWHSFHEIADPKERTAREQRIAHDIVSAGIADGHIDEDTIGKPGRDGKPVRDLAKVWAATKWLYGQQPDFVRLVVEDHLKRVREEGPNDGDDRMSRNPEPAPSRPANGGNGNGQYGPPRSGKALFAWTKEMEQRREVGLLKYLNNWAKLQDYPSRMIDWDADQVAAAYREGCRKLDAIQPVDPSAYEEALAN